MPIQPKDYKLQNLQDEKLQGDYDIEYDNSALILNLDNYGGPLHILLGLARQQKVDLTQISILKLTEQYLHFVSSAKKENIELAGDYLVMAAWLAYLKSRLLLPKKQDDKEEIAPELLSSHLAWRLKRLDAMRNSYEKIFALPQTNIDVFTCKNDLPNDVENTSIYDADILDLLRAYGKQRNKVKAKVHHVKPWPVYSLEEARKSLREKLPNNKEWHNLGKFAPKIDEINGPKPSSKSCYASLLSAGLEMVKRGEIRMQQLAIYDIVYLQKKMD